MAIHVFLFFFFLLYYCICSCLFLFILLYIMFFLVGFSRGSCNNLSIFTMTGSHSSSSLRMLMVRLWAHWWWTGSRSASRSLLSRLPALVITGRTPSRTLPSPLVLSCSMTKQVWSRLKMCRCVDVLSDVLWFIYLFILIFYMYSVLCITVESSLISHFLYCL